MNRKLILTITIILVLIFVPIVTVKTTTSPYAIVFRKSKIGSNDSMIPTAKTDVSVACFPIQIASTKVVVW